MEITQLFLMPGNSPCSCRHYRGERTQGNNPLCYLGEVRLPNDGMIFSPCTIDVTRCIFPAIWKTFTDKGNGVASHLPRFVVDDAT